MLCLRSIVVLMLGSPAATPVDTVADASAPPPSAATGVPNRGIAPLAWSPPTQVPGPLSAPLHVRIETPTSPATAGLPTDGVVPLVDADPGGPAPPVAAPLDPGSAPPAEPAGPRRIDLVRLELLVGPVWRLRPAELMALGSVEFGHLRGFSGAVQGGVIVAPDRDVIAAIDFPLGAGAVYRQRFGRTSLHGSVGLTAGLLIHRAATDRGLVHRVDPDFQLPLRLAWTVGEVGFSVALLQGFSTRSRTYERRGTEVWHRIAYRIGFALGIHFDLGVGRPRSRRSDRTSKGLP